MLERSPGYWKIEIGDANDKGIRVAILDDNEKSVNNNAKLGDLKLMEQAPLMYDMLWDAIAFMDGKNEHYNDPQLRDRFRNSVVELFAFVYVIPHQSELDYFLIPQYLIDEVENKVSERKKFWELQSGLQKRRLTNNE